eukprot:TRINITY_DN3004_c0_g1_i7.p1 TRINITY_DN3004_c0_g1~~TRINITY_DN3004_c0_g1_i7.p1  ORF type:complete len:232 (-),score=64.04 TRINITY_DN3004_c0_g1_i7:411-1106(-)
MPALYKKPTPDQAASTRNSHVPSCDTSICPPADPRKGEDSVTSSSAQRFAPNSSVVPESRVSVAAPSCESQTAPPSPYYPNIAPPYPPIQIVNNVFSSEETMLPRRLSSSMIAKKISPIPKKKLTFVEEAREESLRHMLRLAHIGENTFFKALDEVCSVSDKCKLSLKSLGVLTATEELRNMIINSAKIVRAVATVAEVENFESARELIWKAMDCNIPVLQMFPKERLQED